MSSLAREIVAGVDDLPLAVALNRLIVRAPRALLLIRLPL